MSDGMNRYVLRRLIQFPVVMFLASVVIFLVIHLPQGGPSDLVLGVGATEEQILRFQARYHLNEPLYIQYLIWLEGVLTGSLGQSIFTYQPVSEMMIERLPVTFALAIGSIIVSVSIALPAGYISAVNQYSWKDHISTLFAFLGLSIPNFFLAIILIQIFAVELGWLPITGTNIFQSPINAIVVLTMPVIALGTALAAQTMRLLRSSMLEIFSEEYVRVARAKGLPQKIVNRYVVFKNALIPVITIVALQFGFLLGGTVVIEEVFALPGLGRLMLTAVNNRDLPVLQGTLLFFTAVFITVNLIADLLYAYIDPRIKHGGEEQ